MNDPCSPQTPSSHLPSLRRAIVPVTLALMVGAFVGSPALAQEAIRYQVSTEVDGGSWGDFTVEQGPELTVARHADAGPEGPPVLLAGPAVGGAPATAYDAGVRLLVGVMERQEDFGAGFRKESPYGASSGGAVVDSVRYEWSEEGRETVGEREATHVAITVHVWWRHIRENGTEIPVTDRGRADLWFADELPFSWLPFGLHPNRPGLAFPLFMNWPEVAGAVMERFGSEMEGLGLLLRAETLNEATPGPSPDPRFSLAASERRTAVGVTGIEPISTGPDASEWTDAPRLTRAQGGAVEAAWFTMMACEPLESAEDGSYDFRVSGPAELTGDGSGALVLTDAGFSSGDQPGWAVAAGGMSETGVECMLVILPGESPASGTFPIGSMTSSRPGAEPEGETAAVLYLGASAEAERALLVERGEVRVDVTESGAVSGEVVGEGLRVDIFSDGRAEVVEGAALEYTFEAVSPEG